MRSRTSTEIAFVGDLHLDALLKYWPEANLLQLGAVRKVLSSCVLEGIEHVVFLGDIADGIRDSTGTAMRLSEGAQCGLLDLLIEFDGKLGIHIIPGNHDHADIGNHSLQLFLTMQKHGLFKSTRFYYTPTKTKIDGVPVHFLPWPHKTPDPRAVFGVAHYEVSGASSDSGKQLRGDMHEYDTIVMQGHLHTRQRVRNHIYPGTLYQMNFGESLPKGYGVVRVNSSGKLKYRWVEVDPPFKLYNIVANSLKDLKPIVKDPYRLYKLFVSDNVTIPSDFLTRYPNIVNSLQFSDGQELQSLQDAEFDIGSSVEEFNHAQFLEPFLQAQKAPAWQIKRAIEIMEGV